MIPWNKGQTEAEMELRRPMPFTVPLGYTNPFMAQEVKLEKLWKGKGEFLRQFKPKPKTYWGLDRDYTDKEKEAGI